MQHENLHERSFLRAFLGAGHRKFAGISIEMRREPLLNPHKPNISQGLSLRVRAARSV